MKRLLPLLTLAVSAANAQCVMCFRTAAAQQVERARVLNIGIGMMLLPPVLILAGFLYLAYRRNATYGDHEGGEPERWEPPKKTAALRQTDGVRADASGRSVGAEPDPGWMSQS